MKINKTFEIRERALLSVQTLFSIFMLCLFVACEDSNSLHQEYYDRGEGIYIGAVDSLKSQVGYEKIHFSWEINADPRIKNVIIYWEQRTASLVLEVNRTQSGRQKMEYFMEKMPEKNYIFEFVTTDGSGHCSVEKEIVVEVLGKFYAESLKVREISSVNKTSDNNLTITWGDVASSYLKYTTLEYVLNGEKKSVRVENNESTTVLTGLDLKDEVEIFSTYLPENSFEFFDSSHKKYLLGEI